jgi:hypothetical protein
MKKDEEDEEEDPWGGSAVPPLNEAARMNLLRELNVLDSEENEAKFDDITRVVSVILDFPIVLVSLVAEDNQWFKSRCGLDALSTGRDVSFCAWTLLPASPAMLIVNDAKADKRFAKNPLVLDNPFIRFYAGCPLVTSDGLRLGAFCIIDRVPRQISPSQQQLVINFSELIIRELEENKLASQKASVQFSDEGSGPTCKDFESGQLRADRMRESLSEPLLLVTMNAEDPFWPILYANEEWNNLTKMVIRAVGHSANDRSGKSTPTTTNLVQKHFLQCLDPINSDGESKAQTLSKEFGVFVKEGVCFGLTCVTKSPERIKFKCRCQPADRPLDAAAEAIQLVRDPTTSPEETDAMHNRLYFVVMTKADESPAPSAVTSNSSVSRRKPLESSSGNDGSVDSYELLDKPSSMKGKTLDSLSYIRSPKTPFSDVRLLKKIGKGSFAQVYYGLWIGQAVAVKVARWTKSKPEEAAPIFEGALAVELSHPNLVQTFKYNSVMVEKDVDVENAASLQRKNSSGVSTEQVLAASVGDEFETWITQEWCEMGTLMARIDQKPPMKLQGLEEVVGICVDISSAMTYMHGRNIIHGDLTANNVLLTCKPTCKKGYICKVSDFGLSRILEGEDSTIWTQQLGTVTYMPPDLFETDDCRLSAAADVYAIGILMWQTYTGQVPFKGLTAPQVIVQVARGMGLSLPDVPAHGDPLYSRLFHHCHERDPDLRPSSSDVLDKLLEFASRMEPQPAG